MSDRQHAPGHDAFDQFRQWIAGIEKPAGQRRPIPADVLAAALSLPATQHVDRDAVNEAVRGLLSRRAARKTVWLYFDPRNNAEDADRVKVFATREAADA